MPLFGGSKAAAAALIIPAVLPLLLLLARALRAARKRAAFLAARNGGRGTHPEHESLAAVDEAERDAAAEGAGGVDGAPGASSRVAVKAGHWCGPLRAKGLARI